MKYFEKLPKRNYETSLGNFTISDFFSYYKFNTDLVTTKSFEYDSKTTLIEAGANLYNDPNSFWLFLLANKWINPFTLLEDNLSIFTKRNENKVATKIKTGVSEFIVGEYMTPGTLVFPQQEPSGPSYDFSSVGSFDINGPIYLVEDQDFYTKRITLKPTSSDQKITVDAGTTLAYADLKYKANWPDTAGGTLYVSDETLDELNVNAFYVQTTQNKVATYRRVQTTDVPFFDNTATTTTKTQEQAVKDADKKINSFVPSELSKITTRLVTIKYS